MIAKQILKFQSILFQQQLIRRFSVWKTPVNLQVEKTIFPTAKEMFPKENPSIFEDYNTITPSLFKDVLRYKAEPNVRAAYMQFAKKNGEMFHIFDASKIPLGRLGQKASYFLQGKHRPTFKNSSQVMQDNIVVVNAQNIMLTGKKALLKTIKYHSGFVGGLKERSYKTYLLEKPETLIYYCISKMLPKNNKRRNILKKIEIFRDSQHSYKEFPNFIPHTDIQVDEKLHNPFLHDMEDIIIKYQSSKEIPKEFDGYKKDIDPEIEIPFNERSKIMKLNAHNRKVMKQWKRYYRIMRRYKVHKIKMPLNRDPNLHNESILVTSEKQIKKYSLGHLVQPEEVPEDDDELTKSFPKPKSSIR